MGFISWLKQILKRKKVHTQLPTTQLPTANRLTEQAIPTISKTEISRFQARIRNIERRKKSIRQYRGKFKPRPAHEKRLWKPDKTPEH